MSEALGFKVLNVACRKIVIGTHGGCPDGLACAYLLAEYCKGKGIVCKIVEVFGHDIKASITKEELEGCDILYILDIACSKEILAYFKELVPKVIVVDHHKPSLELVDEPDCHVVVGECASIQVFKLLYPGEPVPMYLKYINARDVWDWSLPNSKEFSAGYVKLLAKIFNIPEKINLVMIEKLAGITSEQELEIIELGKKLIALDNAIIKKAAERAGFRQLILPNGGTLRVKFLELLTKEEIGLRSDIGDALIENPEDVAMLPYSIEREPDIYCVAMRSDKIDVNEIALQFGGKGHAKAAGFTYLKSNTNMFA